MKSSEKGGHLKWQQFHNNSIYWWRSCAVIENSTTATILNVLCEIVLPVVIITTKDWLKLQCFPHFLDSSFHWHFQAHSCKASLKDDLSGCCFTCGLSSLHLVFLSLLPIAVFSFVTHQPRIRNTDYMLVINETMDNISYTMCDSSALCSFPHHNTKTCLKHKKLSREGWGDKQVCFLPTGCSIQCVMEDQSLWPTGGLLQPLAETHTIACALWILYNWNLFIYKKQNPCCASPFHRYV